MNSLFAWQSQCHIQAGGRRCSCGSPRAGDAPDQLVPVVRDKHLANARQLEEDDADLARIIDDEVVVVGRRKVVVEVPCESAQVSFLHATLCRQS